MTCRGLNFFLFFREVVLGEVRGDWEEGISEKVEAFLNYNHPIDVLLPLINCMHMSWLGFSFFTGICYGERT